MTKDAITQKIKSLAEPASYYVGTSEINLIMPKNILVVGRYSQRLPSIADLVHHRFLLAINLEGKGNVIVDSVRHSYLPDHCFLIFPHQCHHFFYQTPNIKWIFITFESKETDYLEKLRNNIVVLSNDAMRFLEILVTCYVNKKQFNSTETAKVTLLTQLLLNELMQSKHFIDKSHPASFVDKVNQFIGANIEHPFSISEIAQKFSCSPSHLRHVYRKFMGVSLGRYLKEIKLHKAQGLLGTTDMTISEIAQACGYDSLYSFSHAFKSYLKISPVVYRKKVNQVRYKTELNYS
jgi:AraC-like DNA-binding protein